MYYTRCKWRSTVLEVFSFLAPVVKHFIKLPLKKGFFRVFSYLFCRALILLARYRVIF